MTLHGWIAVSKHGVILSSFREDQAEAEAAARQILRLVGGAPLLTDFRLVKATLFIYDDDKTESA
jgi:hypothetical protein